MSARRPSLALLTFASSLSPFGMAVVLPIVGTLSTHYGVGFTFAQFVISAYLFGLGITQPFSGWLCDHLGRRPVLLGGTALFGLASVACALSESFVMLVAFRFLQAVGISVGTVASRAIIRDTHDPIGSVRALSALAAGLGVAPVVAPVIGGILGERFGPPGVFAVTAMMAAIVIVWLYMKLPETGTRQQGGAGGAWWTGFGELLASRSFVGNTLLFGFIQGTFFVFLAVGATVFENDLGLGQQAFGTVWGALGVVYVLSAALAGRLADRFGVHAVVRAGGLITLVAGWGIALLTTLQGVTLVTLIVPMFGLMVASGIVTPMAMAGAVIGRAAVAGKAAGLSSAVGLVLSGSFSIVSGAIFTGSFTSVAWLMAGAATVTAAMIPVTRPLRTQARG